MDIASNTNSAQDASQAPRTGKRYLIVVRAGDESFHMTWLTPGVTRNWDLHVSYFGAKDAPAGAETGQFTWSKDGGTSKWNGLDACLSKRPFDVGAYDYIAAPDDDLVVSAETWNRAFEISAQYNLAVSQLSLDRRSFYSFGLTIQRPQYLLRFVDIIEYMPPIMRRDAFERFAKLLPEKDNAWGLEHVMAAAYRDNPRAMAVIDATPALHTREVGVSAMYKHFQSTGKTMEDLEEAYLASHGVKKTLRTALGAIDRNGKEVTDLGAIRRPVFLAKALKTWRKFRHIERIGPDGR